MRKKLEAILTSMKDKTELQSIKELLQEEGNQRALRGQQQTDSVRYLNGLNSWLKPVVTNGASQTQAGTEIQVHFSNYCKTCTNTLQISIDNSGVSLVSLSPYITIDLVVNQEHENFFRGIAAELLNEIRGERLRFVDAIKEATEINVQTHVEEFKKELKREVHGMTQEIGCFYRERQTMENQITELFAFYSKQTQGIPFAANARYQVPPVGQAPNPSQRHPFFSPERQTQLLMPHNPEGPRAT
ncbi:uncharacterized protein BT62DRAFT_1005629 [Guyanagaster necrorhizus]|uniref:Uncharacterized protein n=1 Tax=Guyanagaster necrorhizus TaxID=856835 RepID=A0A9P7VTL4_9AGAR|nr:uncharacterized protein BT62DRAFT_1005629 [Guyanagaster necrorhizus MCA 3950]KAG7446337.1 hypothetical protein BT62DRAFT_1005629 [Guyanagaster necrorhizus MCA 3950]